jgi:hypothetical protein
VDITLGSGSANALAKQASTASAKSAVAQAAAVRRASSMPASLSGSQGGGGVVDGVGASYGGVGGPAAGSPLLLAAPGCLPSLRALCAARGTPCGRP